MLSSNIISQCTSATSYKSKDFKLSSDIKYLGFNTGLICTQNDLFSVSSVSISVGGKSEVRFYMNCMPEEKQHIKEELLDKQASIIFIGPKYSPDSFVMYADDRRQHMLMGFTNIHSMHFINAEHGLSVSFKHDSGDKKFLYDDQREYVYSSYRSL